MFITVERCTDLFSLFFRRAYIKMLKFLVLATASLLLSWRFEPVAWYSRGAQPVLNAVQDFFFLLTLYLASSLVQGKSHYRP